MKTCETCGKVLNSSMEEFRVNGILQCESCAYPDHKPIINSKAEKLRGSWAKTLKTVGKINILIGIISSLILGVCIYNLIYGDIAFFVAFIVVIIGIMLSVLSSSLLMAFAELAENISVIRYLKENEKNRTE